MPHFVEQAVTRRAARFGCAGAVLLLIACRTPPAPAGPPAVAADKSSSPLGPALRVPYAAAVAIDRRDDDPAWRDAGWTGPLPEPGTAQPARPASNLRLLWTQDALVVCVYAADRDIWTHGSQRDEFTLVVAGKTWQLAPDGVRGGPVLTWSGDVDGAADSTATGDDEEWLVFAALPWAALGGRPAVDAPFAVRISRCDTLEAGERRCATWASERVSLAAAGASQPPPPAKPRAADSVP